MVRITCVYTELSFTMIIKGSCNNLLSSFSGRSYNKKDLFTLVPLACGCRMYWNAFGSSTTTIMAYNVFPSFFSSLVSFGIVPLMSAPGSL